jgi:hypothetical protein
MLFAGENHGNIQNGKSPAESEINDNYYQKMEAVNHEEAPMANTGSNNQALIINNIGASDNEGVLHNNISEVGAGVDEKN